LTDNKNNKSVSVSEHTEVTIPLKNLIGIGIVISLFVGQYFMVNSRIDFLEDGYIRGLDQIKQNTEFRILWPRGDLGQLPEDFEQSVRLDHVEEDIDRILGKIETLGIMIIEDGKK
tara:strand:- start:117 stop:464 length:348 start_codon:yes stop_codon:yes gene_type:complete